MQIPCYICPGKKWFCFLLLICTLILAACEDTNMLMMTSAAADAVRAATLSDKKVQALARHASATIDSQNIIAPPDSPYAKRLQRLVAGHTTRDGYRFNLKVYLTDTANAFAMADGTIRVNSGLMDIMDDGELLFVIGHEMGHVVERHSTKKVLMDYASSAIRKGLIAQQNEVGRVAGSMAGALMEQIVHAQFSQHEERQADWYGLLFLKEEGYDPKKAISALRKLSTLGGNHTFLSSHPAPLNRIRHLDKNEPDDNRDSILESMYNSVKRLVINGVQLLLAALNWIRSFF